MRVWRDQQDIPESASITDAIRKAIAASKALVAFFSATYLLSNPCQQELTAAWLAAQKLEGDPNRRVWVINAESTFDHVPQLFRDQQSSYRPDSARVLVSRFVERLIGFDTGLGSGRFCAPGVPSDSAGANETVHGTLG